MNSKTPWTAGPWRIGDCGTTIFGPPSDQAAPVTIANLLPSTPRVSKAERAAIARLIAAAPELVEALRSLYSMGTNQRTIYNEKLVGNTYAAARALLARLEGGQP